MRATRVFAVLAALVLALIGAQVTNANAAGTGKSNGSATSTSTYGELAFHASGVLEGSSGGFELYEAQGVTYVSGKVQCYYQVGTSSAVFVAKITKGDIALRNNYITVWLAPDQFSFATSSTFTCSSGLITPQRPLAGIESGGYISLR